MEAETAMTALIRASPVVLAAWSTTVRPVRRKREARHTEYDVDSSPRRHPIPRRCRTCREPRERALSRYSVQGASVTPLLLPILQSIDSLPEESVLRARTPRATL